MINNFLTQLLGLNIYVYGLGVFLSIVLFLFLFWRSIRKTSLNEEKLLDALFSSGIVALFMGRAFYIFQNLDLFSKNWLNAFILVTVPGVSEFFFWLGFFGYWFVYSLKKKIEFKNIIGILFESIVSARVLLSLFSLLKGVSYANLLLTGLLIVFGAFVWFIRLSKNEKLKSSSWPFLIMFLSLPNLLVDFIFNSKVYFEGLIGVILGLIILILKLIKKQK